MLAEYGSYTIILWFKTKHLCKTGTFIFIQKVQQPYPPTLPTLKPPNSVAAAVDRHGQDQSCCLFPFGNTTLHHRESCKVQDGNLCVEVVKVTKEEAGQYDLEACRQNV